MRGLVPGRMRSLASLAVLSLVALSATGAMEGCKPKAGGSCTAGQVACGEGKTGLFCVDGAFHDMTCNGPGGCQQSGNTVSCDNAIAAVGDGCNTPDDAACSMDYKAALLCKSGAFALAETCKGPGACKVAGDTITCDNDVSDPGDPCRTPGDYACTGDRGSVLRCDSGKMSVLNTCRGPKACSIVNHATENKVEFVCDDSIANDGDACDTNGEEACSMDKKSILVCSSNKFGKPKACTGPAGCTYDEKFDRYTCDQGAEADSGDAGAAGDSAGSAAPGKKKKH
jgi:hypothetical protein